MCACVIICWVGMCSGVRSSIGSCECRWLPSLLGFRCLSGGWRRPSLAGHPFLCGVGRARSREPNSQLSAGARDRLGKSCAGSHSSWLLLRRCVRGGLMAAQYLEERWSGKGTSLGDSGKSSMERILALRSVALKYLRMHVCMYVCVCDCVCSCVW
jgi:hypothetical protein